MATESLSSDESEKIRAQHIEDERIKYLINDLGCTNARVRRDGRLIDQFLLLKALIDGTLPRLLSADILIF